MKSLLLAVASLGILVSGEASQSWNFNFTNQPSKDSINVEPESKKSDLPYQFEWLGAYEQNAGGISSDEPFVFSVNTGEGNFVVDVEFAPSEETGSITIKAESRRLMVQDLSPNPSEPHTYRFIVNVRDSRLEDGRGVKLKEIEARAWHWDDRLQIEINGKHPVLKSLRIERADNLPTLFIAGDSTVTDQRAEPWIGWGQMLPYFMKPTIAVANHAESGLTLREFKHDLRMQKVIENIKPGDFLLIQFGHNDMKEKGEGIGAMTSYSVDLRDLAQQALEKGAHPILITSMKRRRFDEQGRQYASLKDYPLAVRRVAAEMKLPLIDLNLMSGVLYAALGPQDSVKAFVHYPAGTFDGQTKDLKDDSHFNAYGGYELARCIVEGIRTYVPELSKYLRSDISDFDPSTPDPFESISVPLSPVSSIDKPAGN